MNDFSRTQCQTLLLLLYRYIVDVGVQGARMMRYWLDPMSNATNTNGND